MPFLGVEISGSHVATTRESEVFGIGTIVYRGKTQHVWEIRIEDKTGNSFRFADLQTGNCSYSFRKIKMTFDKESYAALCKLQTVCLRQNIPFASYRLPLNREIITVVQHHSMPERLKSLNDLHEKQVLWFHRLPNRLHMKLSFCNLTVFFSNNIAEIYIDKLAANDRFIEIEKNKNTSKSHYFWRIYWQCK